MVLTVFSLPRPLDYFHPILYVDPNLSWDHLSCVSTHVVALYKCVCLCRQFSVEFLVTHRRLHAYLEGAVCFCFVTH